MAKFNLTNTETEHIFPELSISSSENKLNSNSLELHFRGTFDGAKVKFFRIFKEDLDLNKDWIELKISTNDENNNYQKDFIIKEANRIYTLGIGKKTGFIKAVATDTTGNTNIEITYN